MDNHPEISDRVLFNLLQRFIVDSGKTQYGTSRGADPTCYSNTDATVLKQYFPTENDELILYVDMHQSWGTEITFSWPSQLDWGPQPEVSDEEASEGALGDSDNWGELLDEPIEIDRKERLCVYYCPEEKRMTRWDNQMNWSALEVRKFLLDLVLSGSWGKTWKQLKIERTPDPMGYGEE